MPGTTMLYLCLHLGAQLRLLQLRLQQLRLHRWLRMHLCLRLRPQLHRRRRPQATCRYPVPCFAARSA